MAAWLPGRLPGSPPGALPGSLPGLRALEFLGGLALKANPSMDDALSCMHPPHRPRGRQIVPICYPYLLVPIHLVTPYGHYIGIAVDTFGLPSNRGLKPSLVSLPHRDVQLLESHGLRMPRAPAVV